MRLISSQSFQPTSPAHSSLVPGLKVKRKGLRRPWAMIRRALASLLAAIRVVGQGGARGRADPDDAAVEAGWVAASAHVLAAQGAPFGRRGGEGGARRARRVATGVLGRGRAGGATVLAVVDVVEARPVTPAGIQRSVGPELQRADRVAGELLAPVLDQHLLAAGHDVAVGLQA